MAAAIVAGLIAAASCTVAQRDAIAQLELTVTSSTRLLVVAPHPDDEALAAAGLMQRVHAGGGHVRIVVMTSGDTYDEHVLRRTEKQQVADRREGGNIRERESIAAMAGLGIDRSRLRFLGFPDGGLCLLASKYLTSAEAFESPYTDRDRPPEAEQVIRGATYRGVSVRSELEKIITEFEPTIVVAPHARDEHPDHCATDIFVRQALVGIARTHRIAPRRLYYVVHVGAWPVDENGGARLDPPRDVPPDEATWRTFALTDAEAAAKRQVILDYKTQVRTMGTFLLAFARDNELFLESEPAAAAECWCDEQNVATFLPPTGYRHRPKPRQ